MQIQKTLHNTGAQSRQLLLPLLAVLLLVSCEGTPRELRMYPLAYQEGIDDLIPQMKPKIIPARTYDLPGNEGPILTMAVDSLLLTRKDLPENLIYKVAKTVIEQKPRFTALAPQLFSGSLEYSPI